MRLQHRCYKFDTLTCHVQCTQGLGSLEDKDWLIAVAPPPNASQPILEEIAAFQIPGNCFINVVWAIAQSGKTFFCTPFFLIPVIFWFFGFSPSKHHLLDKLTFLSDKCIWCGDSILLAVAYNKVSFRLSTNRNSPANILV